MLAFIGFIAVLGLGTVLIQFVSKSYEVCLKCGNGPGYWCDFYGHPTEMRSKHRWTWK